MLTNAIVKIQTESAAFRAGSFEAGLAEVLTGLCREDSALAHAVAEGDKTVASCAKHLHDYARAHKQGNSYAMPPTEATRLIREHYGVGEQPVAAPTAPVQSNTINILDLLK